MGYMVTVEVNAPCESGRMIPAGSKVEYRGHIPGGDVKVRYDGRDEVIVASTIKELS